MSKAILAALLLSVSSAAFADDDVCVVAANNAMNATVAATITLATATRYMTKHDDWCDGTVASLEQQDGAAVDNAWRQAISAQSACINNDKVSLQMTKLIASLHKRRLHISDTLDALKYKCR